MTSLRAARHRAAGPSPVAAYRLAARSGRSGWRGAAAILIGLALIVGARWLATTSGLDGLAAGTGFGLALGALWLLARWPFRAIGPQRRREAALAPLYARTTAIALAFGVAFGIALVVGGQLGAALGGHPLVPGLGRPAAPFMPWVAITIVVATAEEGILRGVLFDRLRASGGTLVAIVITTIAFALMHVPLYGWHVVPLDLAVGLGFAGLRLSTRSLLAPIAAHALADLATWWL